ncbi:MAG: right-handed parallel beta-helix repeat-containing protein [Clostridia bacterium]|nr:right-handed parallel beta-helix repeat-containing protein [Clostridia bacterium]
MFNIKDYGAVGDGSTLDSHAIQIAIDAAGGAGGGTVYIPEGKYLCGTMHMRSNVHVWLDKGATILGSKDHTDFDPYEDNPSNALYQDRSHSYFHHSLFHADGANDIAITGYGKIDMQSAWEDLEFTEFGDGEEKGVKWCRGAKAIAFKECTNVVIRDLVIRHVTDLAVYVAGCENVTISGLNIFTHVDGISPDSCKNVTISDCIVDSGDDAIVPKCSYTLGRFKAMENLTISNCTCRSSASAIKFGTESNSAYINTTVTGCTVYDTGLEGIFIMTSDGARVEGLSISNVTLKNVAQPIAIIVTDRARGPEGTKVGSISNVAISNVIITGPYWDEVVETMAQNSADYYSNSLTKPFIPMPIFISGLEDSVIRNLSLSNVIFDAPGGGREEDRSVFIPEVRTEYPMVLSYASVAPAYGMYARFVDGLRLYNVAFSTVKPDAREPIVLERVTGYKMV